MNTETHERTSTDHLFNEAKQAANRVTEVAKQTSHDIRVKAEDTVARTGEYVKQNPMSFVFGALATGVALGCLIALTRREPTFRERYVDDHLDNAREAILAVLAPVAQRIHQGYDSADKALHSFNPSRTADSWADQLRRVSSNLKFW